MCLRSRQKLARGLEVVRVDDDLGRPGRRSGGAVRPGGDVRPPEVAVDAARTKKPAQRLGLDLVADHRESRLGHERHDATVQTFVRPDGRHFVRDPDAALLAKATVDLFCTADENEIEPLLALGFVASRREGIYLVPTDVAAVAFPPGVDVVTLDEAHETRLRLLDDELRQDVPGTDGWLWDVAGFHEETYASPGVDVRTYLVAVDSGSGDYVGIARVWMRGPTPRLGFVGVRREYRGRGVGRALVAAVLAEVGRRGIAEVTTEIDETNVASCTLFESLGARRTGTSVELYKPADRISTKAGA